MGKISDLFKKIRDTKGFFHEKNRHNKVQKWKKNCTYIEELYKNRLQDTDNHHGDYHSPTARQPVCEVKWTLGSITMRKASGYDGIPVELFQILKDDAVKVLPL